MKKRLFFDMVTAAFCVLIAQSSFCVQTRSMRKKNIEQRFKGMLVAYQPCDKKSKAFLSANEQKKYVQRIKSSENSYQINEKPVVFQNDKNDAKGIRKTSVFEEDAKPSLFARIAEIKSLDAQQKAIQKSANILCLKQSKDFQEEKFNVLDNSSHNKDVAKQRLLIVPLRTQNENNLQNAESSSDSPLLDIQPLSSSQEPLESDEIINENREEAANRNSFERSAHREGDLNLGNIQNIEAQNTQIVVPEELSPLYHRLGVQAFQIIKSPKFIASVLTLIYLFFDHYAYLRDGTNPSVYSYIKAGFEKVVAYQEVFQNTLMISNPNSSRVYSNLPHCFGFIKSIYSAFSTVYKIFQKAQIFFFR